jgi:hypothetical protein
MTIMKKSIDFEIRLGDRTQGGVSMDITLLAEAVLGVVFQWAAFAPKKVPNYVAWIGLAVSTAALWYWMTPDAQVQLATDWRKAVAAMVSFLLAAKGAGSTAKALGIAPATNTVVNP